MHVDTNSHELKVYQKFFGWAWSEMGVASLVTGLLNWLYLKNELTEWTDFLYADANSRKLKVISIIFWWVWSNMSMVI